MADTTPKMSLRRWDQLSDLFSHDQLSDNWAKIDFHDHTPGRGVQVPTEGIFDGAVTAPKLATGLDPSSMYTTYKPIKAGMGEVGAGLAAGTYVLGENRPSGVGTTFTTAYEAIWYFDPADFVATARSTFLRVRGVCLAGATAPAANFTLGMYPVTAIATGNVTLGTVLAGSTIAWTTPASNSMTASVTSDFAAPTAGFYLLAVVTSATTAASSLTFVRSDLQMRQV